MSGAAGDCHRQVIVTAGYGRVRTGQAAKGTVNSLSWRWAASLGLCGSTGKKPENKVPFSNSPCHRPGKQQAGCVEFVPPLPLPQPYFQ